MSLSSLQKPELRQPLLRLLPLPGSAGVLHSALRSAADTAEHGPVRKRSENHNRMRKLSDWPSGIPVTAGFLPVPVCFLPALPFLSPAVPPDPVHPVLRLSVSEELLCHNRILSGLFPSWKAYPQCCWTLKAPGPRMCFLRSHRGTGYVSSYPHIVYPALPGLLPVSSVLPVCQLLFPEYFR